MYRNVADLDDDINEIQFESLNLMRRNMLTKIVEFN